MATAARPKHTARRMFICVSVNETIDIERFQIPWQNKRQADQGQDDHRDAEPHGPEVHLPHLLDRLRGLLNLLFQRLQACIEVLVHMATVSQNTKTNKTDSPSAGVVSGYGVVRGLGATVEI